MNKPVVGQEYAVFINHSEVVELDSVPMCRCCKAGEFLTACEIPTGTAIDPDSVDTVNIKGLFPGLYGVQIVTPIHTWPCTEDMYIWKLVT